MSILYLASSQAMSALRSRAPSPVSCRVRKFQLRPRVAVVLLKTLPCAFFDRMLDRPVAKESGKGGTDNVWTTFCGPSSTGGEQRRS